MDELAREARLESLRRRARKDLGLSSGKGNNEVTTQNPTASYENKLKAGEKERADKVILGKFHFSPSHGYSSEAILEDPRVAAEIMLRESGLLERNSWAVAQMLREVQPPCAPRPDIRSQIIFEE